MTAAMMLRTGLQVGLFVLLASVMGASGYGHFAAILAVFAFANPLVATGPAFALSQAIVARRLGVAEAFGAGLQAVLVSGLGVLFVTSLLAVLVLPPDISWIAILAVGVSETVCVPLAELAGRVFQATQAPVLLPGLAALVTGLRLCALALWFLGSGVLTVERWALLYALASAVAAAVSLGLLARRRGAPAGAPDRALQLAREGVPIAISSSALRAHAEMDKAVLARLGNAAETGWYSVGSRLIDLFTLPAQARFEAALTRFFREGAEGPSAAWRLARSQMPFLFTLGAGAAAAMLAGAPLLPRLLGDSYAGATLVVQSLCLLPFVAGLRALLRQSLLTSGHARQYAQLETVAAIANVALNVLLVPTLGWRGAVAAAYASGSLMVFGAGWVIARRLARPARAAGP